MRSSTVWTVEEAMAWTAAQRAVVDSGFLRYRKRGAHRDLVRVNNVFYPKRNVARGNRKVFSFGSYCANQKRKEFVFMKNRKVL
ncbi:hypothetical protein Ddye_009559 [Dipteronia dyeriana]|uniref:Uncharacterized protein n=1 Tax=Dipteronia dyeriana TaxID=168575 RepID=A0AAD9XC05_9ROSI|nr:hypothetical protein Ddye_009559 [Dipteronia dyeriana]